MMDRREENRMLNSLERIANTLEKVPDILSKLGEEPEIMIEAGPPLCPHCNKFNPEVDIEDTEGSGPIFEYYMKARCHNCGHVFYAIPQTWHMFARESEVATAMQERLNSINVN
jgi:hypothetical protein